MSDDERALIGKRRGATTPGPGVPEEFPPEDTMPVIVPADMEDTPVLGPKRPVIRDGKRHKRMTEQEFAEAVWMRTRELRDRIAEINTRIDQSISINADRVTDIATKTSQIEGRLDALDHLGESTDELRDLRADYIELRTRLFGIHDKNGRLGDIDREIVAVSHKATAGRRWAIGAGGAVIGSLVGAVLFVWKLNGDAVDRAATVRSEIEASKVDRAEIHRQVNLLFRILNRPEMPGMGVIP